jgi:aldoxime dehydratase
MGGIRSHRVREGRAQPAEPVGLRAVKTLVFGQFGVQAPSARDASAAARSFLALWRGTDGPAQLERGRFVDAAGTENVVWLAYWLDGEAYERWRGSPKVTELWWGLPLDGAAGYWREISMIPRDHLDAIYSQSEEVPYLSAWSSVLDIAHGERMLTEPLRPELAAFTPTRAETRHRRIQLDGPGNLCLIRSGPELVWGHMTADLGSLIANPGNGCIAARRVREQDVQGLDRGHTYTIAWFLSFSHLLRWARTHNAHLLIYASFFKMVAGRDARPLDRTWCHEVSVLPRGYVSTEYVNCHNGTGLLPLLDSAVEMVRCDPSVGRDGP